MPRKPPESPELSLVNFWSQAAKVNEPSVNDWLRTFQPIRERYSLQKTFNMDESGIFFNLLPERSLDLKGNKYHGGARSKEWLTAVFCCNADGSEKHKVWIIGKSKNPRCLKNVNRLYLPCEYSHHRAAWIESTSLRPVFIVGNSSSTWVSCTQVLSFAQV
jgi:hypothetical protein